MPATRMGYGQTIPQPRSSLSHLRSARQTGFALYARPLFWHCCGRPTNSASVNCSAGIQGSSPKSVIAVETLGVLGVAAWRRFERHPGIGLISCFLPRNTKGPIRGAHRDLYQKTVALESPYGDQGGRGG